MLRSAGFGAAEPRAIGDVTPPMLLDAGYMNKQVSAAFTKAEIDGASARRRGDDERRLHGGDGAARAAEELPAAREA